MKNQAVKAFVAVLLIALFAVPMNAFAVTRGTVPYHFTFSDEVTVKQGPFAQKNDSEQNWYVSLHDYNTEYGVYNTVSNSNLLGIRLKKLGNIDGYDHNNIGGYHLHWGTNNYMHPYLYYATTDMTFYMNAKKDDTSTSTATLYASGNFTP